MRLRVETIHEERWRARRVPGGVPLLCETTREAAAVLLRLIVEGEPCARAVRDHIVELLACDNGDGSATIGGRHGFRVTELATQESGS